MRNECSWTFWKWENKIFNFHVGQKFIWSLYDEVIVRRRTFHFWQFPITSQLTIFGNFLSDLKFFTVDVWHVIWGLYGHEWDLSNHFPPSNYWLNAQLTTVDFARVLVDWTMPWWISNLYHLRSWFKMMSQLIWTLDEWSWCPNSSRMATIHCSMNDLTVWLLIASAASNKVRWQYFCTLG